MSEEAALSREFDVFYHYDSLSAVLEDGIMTIKVPKDGFYYVSISNIFLDYQAVPPPVGTSFLVIEKLDQINNGNCSTGNPKQSNKVLYPLNDASSNIPETKVYNRVLLTAEDTIKLSIYDISLTKFTVARIAATLHISSKADIIRNTL